MRHFWLSPLVFLTALPLAGFTTPVEPWDDMRVMHTWHAIPVNWESLGHPAVGTTLNVYIALKPDQESALTDALDEISSPRHPRYGAHLSKEQVAELVNPHPDTLKLVRAWLEHHGIRPSSISTTHSGAWLKVTNMLVSQANQLLSASYQLYRNSETNETIIRTVGYSVPSLLHTHIQTIAPTTNFVSTRIVPQTPRRRPFGAASAQAKAAPGESVTPRFMVFKEIVPAILRWMYGTYAYEVAAADGLNRLAIVGINENPSQGDMNKFNTDYITYTDGTFNPVEVNGGVFDPASPGFVANAGVQYAGAISYPTPLTFYCVGYTYGDAFLEFLDYLLHEPVIMPQTISIPYSIGKERQIPTRYTAAVCLLFEQLGGLGVTVLVSSGVHGVGHGDCIDFVPEFPSTCPYVTSVGGTTSRITLKPEVAASISGGGFSDYFRRPSYQNTVVPKYLEYLGAEYEDLYNSEGRGYPDISAQAFNFSLIYGNTAYVEDGTIFSVSTVAGIVALINDFLISKGKPPLGFLNPLLYGVGLQGLNDVTSGSNPGCRTEGFPATKGWDPVTGLGTPNFQKLLDILREIWGIEPEPERV